MRGQSRGDAPGPVDRRGPVVRRATDESQAAVARSDHLLPPLSSLSPRPSGARPTALRDGDIKRPPSP
ncbi:hypothetical protein CMUS01_01447 [Colletotrichum musicola]|uniref:Uncharacterized protein n=1 Tax=Colletotrichum musicola TaxID=2175873 RepID=A0A8H6U8J9_9PEZI|nr:hypothetical protein CMUS01_01447 [Colletotrichum musicola]